MPGLWLLAPGSRGLWLLQPEQNPPIQREHGPLLSPLKPMKKHLMQLQAGTTVRRKQAPVQLCQRVTELFFFKGSLPNTVPWYGWSKHEEPFLSCEPHSAAHPETECLWYLPKYSTPERGRLEALGVRCHSLNSFKVSKPKVLQLWLQKKAVRNYLFLWLDLTCASRRSPGKPVSSM